MASRLRRAGSRANLGCLQSELMLAQVAHVVRELVVEVAGVLAHLRLQAGEVCPHLWHRTECVRPPTR